MIMYKTKYVKKIDVKIYIFIKKGRKNRYSNSTYRYNK